MSSGKAEECSIGCCQKEKMRGPQGGVGLVGAGAGKEAELREVSLGDLTGNRR